MSDAPPPSISLVIVLVPGQPEYNRRCLDSAAAESAAVAAETAGITAEGEAAASENEGDEISSPQAEAAGQAGIPPVELVVVDNDCGEATRLYLQEFAGNHPESVLIHNPADYGLAHSLNCGAAAARGEILVFVSGEAVLASGSLGPLLRWLRDPGLGLVGPVTNRSEDASMVPVEYSDLSEMPAFAGRYTRAHAGQARPVDRLGLFCAALRRPVYAQVGPLDERFGAYADPFVEEDYALRLKENGYHLLCAEDSFVHRQPPVEASFTRRWLAFEDNRKKFEARWGRPWTAPRWREELLDRQVAELAEARARLALQVIEQEQESARLAALNLELEERLQATGMELVNIRFSRVWKILQATWKLQARLFPPGSRTERLALAGFQEMRSLYYGLRARQQERSAAGREQRFARQLHDLLRRHPNRRELVVFLPSLDWDITLFQRPHQMAMAYARQGCLTLYCEPPGTALFRWGFHPVSENLYIANVPLEIFRQVASPLVITLAYNRHYLPAFTRPRLVYEYIDELDVFPGDLEELKRNHAELVRSAGLVVATAEKLLQEVRQVRPDAILCPNAVNLEHIQHTLAATSAPPEDIRSLVESGRPVIGYFGALARWFDYDLLLHAALERPGYHFLLIGPDYDGSIHKSRLRALENITWLGPRPYSAIHSYLKYFSVATIPFKLNEITHATSPLKLFEYMSARKPIVTTAMHESSRYPVVLIAGDENEFVRQLDRALALRADSAYLEALEHTARQNTWELRVEQILQAVPREAAPAWA